MKKARLAMLALVAVAMFGGAGASSADPYGSSETGGQVTCGGTAAPGGLFNVNATPTSGNGVQVCNDGPPITQVQGRITVHREPGGRVSVIADGDADFVSVSWSRVDVNATGACKVRARRGVGDGNAGGEPTGTGQGTGGFDSGCIG